MLVNCFTTELLPQLFGGFCGCCLFFKVSERVLLSCSCWSQTHCVVQKVLELVVLLPLPQSTYKCAPSHLVEETHPSVPPSLQWASAYFSFSIFINSTTIDHLAYWPLGICGCTCLYPWISECKCCIPSSTSTPTCPPTRMLENSSFPALPPIGSQLLEKF